MDKKAIIAQLRKAKTAHIRWRSYAQALVSGIPMDEGKVPVIYTDCDFGRWYYGEGQALAGLAGYRAIDDPHEQLHAVYLDIFQHLFEDDDISLFDRLRGRKVRTPENRQLEIHGKLEELLRISERLLSYIDELEHSVMALDDEILANMF